MDEVARIADLVRKAVMDALNGGDLATTERLTVTLPQAERERAKDLALIKASEALAEEFEPKP